MAVGVGADGIVAFLSVCASKTAQAVLYRWLVQRAYGIEAVAGIGALGYNGMRSERDESIVHLCSDLRCVRTNCVVPKKTVPNTNVRAPSQFPHRGNKP